MAEDGGGCCKVIFSLLSTIFELVGFATVGLGVWLKDNTHPTAVGIMIAQGALLVIVGTGGLCCVCKKSRSGLKGFSVLLALLALADIIIGMVVHFMCTEDCGLIPRDTIKAPVVMGIFLGTAVLLIMALVCSICLLKQKRRINVEVTARFSAKL